MFTRQILCLENVSVVLTKRRIGTVNGGNKRRGKTRRITPGRKRAESAEVVEPPALLKLRWLCWGLAGKWGAAGK